MVQDKIIYSLFSIFVLLLAGTAIIIAFYPDENEESPFVEDGDCIFFSYVGRYAENNTIFTSSYEDPKNLTNTTPFPAFISLDKNKTSWDGKFSKVIYGLMEGMIGMKEGESKTIGPIPPEKAFYYNPTLGVRFNSTIATFGSLSQELKILSLNDTLDVWWINGGEVGDISNPPRFLFDVSNEPSYGFDISSLITYTPPFFLFKNASKIINNTDDFVTYRLLDDAELNLNISKNNIIEFEWGLNEDERAYIFYGSTNVSMTNDTFTIHIDPPQVKQIILPGTEGFSALSVVNVSNSSITITIDSINETLETVEFPRELTFERQVRVPRHYSIIPYYYNYLNEDLEEQNLGLNPYAGKTIIYDVTVPAIYKYTSN